MSSSPMSAGLPAPDDQAMARRGQLPGRGIVTLAHGHRRYIGMAKTLGRTLRLHCDHIPRAVITDADDPELDRLYHIRIPFRPELGTGMEQKLSLDRYSPFEQTLFIDSDCLVVRDIDTLWALFSDVPVGVIGSPMCDGYWFGDVAKICAHFHVASIPRFNSGLLYFDASDQAAALFASAREIMARYEELGFTPMLRGSRNDEPVLAFALAIHGVPGIQDGGVGMRTPIGLRGPLAIDVLRGYCRFNKDGALVEPAIAHFCGWRARAFHYRRERLKLALAARCSLPRPLISVAVNALADPPYRFGSVAGRPAFLWLERRIRQRQARRAGRPA